MNWTKEHDRRLTDAVAFVGRCGAAEFEIGYLVDDPPPDVANWYASAKFRKGTLVTIPQMSPWEAAETLANMLRKGATCAWCARPIAWGDRPKSGTKACWWRKVGGRWERGCPKRDEPTIKGTAMKPIKASQEQIDYWAERDGYEPARAIIGGPEEAPDVIPCPALVTREAGMVHVAFELDEIEVAQLARGGTLWLTTWGGLPIHLVEVVPREQS